MKEIKLKINPEQLHAINMCLAGTSFNLIDAKVPENKAIFAIVLELRSKLLKKEIDKATSVKSFPLSLKYYQAFSLLQILQHLNAFEKRSYERNAILIICNEIDKQL